MPLALLCLSLVAGAQLKVAVPGLEPQGVAPELAASLDGVILTRLGELPDAQVVALADFKQIVNQEQRRQLVGCGDDGKCVANLPGELDAERLLWGVVGKVGERYIVTLALIDTQSNAVVRRVTREATTPDALVRATGEATDALWKNPELPLSGCVDCGGRNDASFRVALMLGNNFASAFSKGVDVSLFGPGTKLDIAYRVEPWLSVFFGTGFSLGSGDSKKSGDVRFQVVPVNLGVRYQTGISESLGAYAGLGLGVGFVRAALADVKNIKPAFAAEAESGLEWHAMGALSLLLEGSYELTLNTPAALRSHPLGSLAVRAGVGYGF